MRTRLLTLPWWALALGLGAFSTIVVAVVLHSAAPGREAVAVPAGVLLGLVLGRLVADTNHEAVAVAGIVNGHDLGRAIHASRRGPVPTDPRVRQAALRLAAWRLSRFESQRSVSLLVSGVGFPVYAVLAIISSPWWWAAAALFAVSLLETWLLPGRLARRVHTLEHPA
ncbi:hypothetical protein [Kineosporia succinea]|uniref:Lysophospholipase L1 biosynthesis ABC-type transport system permease subunit n=1 Tax=Kineosporia succinea TaxID=84632 RepID=A0ABT9NXV6_9ACTN|nr:hypothetical protein [Kineosporia succinea]MDP9824984.1 putative lysophospholipase L1 biosynthesis ABC-type transport system permease subunit [Kineosporia succinea]